MLDTILDAAAAVGPQTHMITRYTRKALRTQSLQAEASDSTGLFRFSPLRHFSGSAHRFSEASTAATLAHLNSQGNV